MASIKRTINGVEWQCTNIGNGKIVFSAEMPAREVEQHVLVKKARQKAAEGWELEVLTHEMDPDYADPGRPYIIVRIPESADIAA